MPTTPSDQPESGFEPAKLYLWVKGLETKVNTLLREVDLLKNDFIRKNAQLRKELSIVSEDLLESRRTQQQVQQKMDLVIQELKQTAGIEELQTIKKYLEYWNPMSFVTQRDVERVVEEKLKLKNGAQIQAASPAPVLEMQTQAKAKKDFTPFH